MSLTHSYRRLLILTTCYLSAFAVIIAGFLYERHTREEAERRRESTYRHLTLAEGVEYAEALTEALADLASLSPEARPARADAVRLYASLAAAAFGHARLTGIGGERLLCFLDDCGVLASDALTHTSDALWSETGQVLSRFAAALTQKALPRLAETAEDAAFEDALLRVFGDTRLETALYESGYEAQAVRPGFAGLTGAAVEETEAMARVRAYVGENARLSLASSGESPAVYTVTGTNIAATLSRQGGVLLQLLFDTAAKEIRISAATAREAAQALLSREGLSSLVEQAAVEKDACYVFTFVPYTEGVCCDSEQVLVGITADTGRVCLYDATAYYRYHTGHVSLPDTYLSAEDVAARYGTDTLPCLCKIERATGVETVCYRLSRPVAGSDGQAGEADDRVCYADLVTGDPILPAGTH